MLISLVAISRPVTQRLDYLVISLFSSLQRSSEEERTAGGRLIEVTAILNIVI